MIMPSRWYAGGKGLDSFRDNMLKDQRISVLVDYFDSTECFPGVDISGGICYFLWDANSNAKCNVTTIRHNNINSLSRKLLLDDDDTFIRFNEAINIIEKINTKDRKTFSQYISSRKPFGLNTSIKVASKGECKEPIFIYAYPNNGYIDLPKIKCNKELINKFKVCISYAYGERGNFPYFVIGKPFIADKDTCCSETYLVAYSSDDLYSIQSVVKYMKTKFLRFLVLLRKNTQHATKGVYNYVPVQDFTEKSDIDWSKSVAEIDQQLYKKYNLSDEEIAFIESMIKPME